MAEMNYETAVKRLEAIVAKLEKGGLSLEEMMKLYEEGTQMSAFCAKRLDEAQLKIDELAAVKGESNG